MDETNIEVLASMDEDEFEAHLAEMHAEKYRVIGDIEAAEIEAYLASVNADDDEF